MEYPFFAFLRETLFMVILIKSNEPQNDASREKVAAIVYETDKMQMKCRNLLRAIEMLWTFE